MVFIRSERSGRSRPPLQKCRKAAPPKKCREVSTTVVLNQGGFGGRWNLPNTKIYNQNGQRLKKNKKKKKKMLKRIKSNIIKRSKSIKLR